MSEAQKQDIRDMLDILKDLNAEDLSLIKGGAMILKAKQDMDRDAEKKPG